MEKTSLMEQIEQQIATVPDRGVTELALLVFNQIDAEMKRQGMSKSQLAEHAGVNRAFVSRILNNPSNVTLGTIVRLANALDLQIEAPRLISKSAVFEPVSLLQLIDDLSAGGEAGGGEGSLAA